MLCLLFASALTIAHTASAQRPVAGDAEPPVKYAIFSPAWNQSSNAGLRIVAQNLTSEPVELVSVVFHDEEDPAVQATVELNLEVPAKGWAERQLPYLDLLFGNQCIARTAEQDWRLVEISNYTLNPSVRGLIIEDTDSFRIYQCVRAVQTTWLEMGEEHQQSEWVLYHYERRSQFN